MNLLVMDHQLKYTEANASIKQNLSGAVKCPPLASTSEMLHLLSAATTLMWVGFQLTRVVR